MIETLIVGIVNYIPSTTNTTSPPSSYSLKVEQCLSLAALCSFPEVSPPSHSLLLTRSGPAMSTLRSHPMTTKDSDHPLTEEGTHTYTHHHHHHHHHHDHHPSLMSNDDECDCSALSMGCLMTSWKLLLPLVFMGFCAFFILLSMGIIKT